MSFTVEKNDQEGYVAILEDGVVIARARSTGQAKRIVHALQMDDTQKLAALREGLINLLSLLK